MMKNIVKLSSVLLSGLGAHAAVISVDLDVSSGQGTYTGSTVTSGLVPLAGQVGLWNGLSLQSNITASTTTFVANNLTDGAGAGTLVDFAFNTSGGSFMSFGAGNSALGADVAFLNRDNFSTAVSIDWEFTDLAPNVLYDIRILGRTFAGSAVENFANFTAGSEPAKQMTTITNHVDFRVRADVSGKIEGTFSQLPMELDETASMSGIQIELVPEPSTGWFLGFSLVSIFVRRR